MQDFCRFAIIPIVEVESSELKGELGKHRTGPSWNSAFLAKVKSLQSCAHLASMERISTR